jgi:hypothetical protein
MERMILLESGRWYARIDMDAGRREHLVLTDPSYPSDCMRARLPFSWRQQGDGALEELARDPAVRLWTDEYGIQWRIAVVGPESPYDIPLHERYLVFDSRETWAGVTPLGDGRRLGELDSDELRELRDRASDIGGGRRRFRPPTAMPEA